MGYNGVSFVMELLTAVHESSTPVKDCVVCGWAKNDCFMTLLTGTKLLLFCFSSNVTTISTYSLVQDVYKMCQPVLCSSAVPRTAL